MKTLTFSTMLLALFLTQAAVAQDQAKPEAGNMTYGTQGMPGKMPPPGGGYMMQRGGPGMWMGHSDHGMFMGGHDMWGGHGGGIMLDRLQPPTMLMRYQEELKLTPKQIDAIKKEMKTFQSNIVDVEWDLQSSTNDLRNELKKDNIDKSRALSLMDKVMAAENSLKKQHLAMLIGVHNVLTADQIQELNRLVHRHFGMFRHHRTQPMKMDRGRR